MHPTRDYQGVPWQFSNHNYLTFGKGSRRADEVHALNTTAHSGTATCQDRRKVSSDWRAPNSFKILRCVKSGLPGAAARKALVMRTVLCLRCSLFKANTASVWLANQRSPDNRRNAAELVRPQSQPRLVVRLGSEQKTLLVLDFAMYGGVRFQVGLVLRHDEVQVPSHVAHLI